MTIAFFCRLLGEFLPRARNLFYTTTRNRFGNFPFYLPAAFLAPCIQFPLSEIVLQLCYYLILACEEFYLLLYKV